uniref:Sialic acid-binding Ig-like lectin 14 n=1 Tax=Takifugu rubripes TaxID=31033 RepID=A0A674NA83_TAKRU
KMSHLLLPYLLHWCLNLTGSSVMLEKRCMSGFCVSFPEEEIEAEAGLCVVIPCSFSKPSSFKPQNIVWFKCDASKSECAESDIIFHLNRRKVQDGFKERVSLLEPDLSLENCSIIVNDLTESDSGSYQLKLNALSQKPTVTVPPLTEGQQGSLTCTAPGLCSGSGPKITWTWTEGGKEDSTLTFNSLAESHDANVTCAVRYRNNITTFETVTLNVTYVKEIEVSGAVIIREGETLNLTCSLDSFPPSAYFYSLSQYSPSRPPNYSITQIL